MPCTTECGSVSLLYTGNGNLVLTIVTVKGLADGEVQILKSKVLEAQGPDAAA